MVKSVCWQNKNIAVMYFKIVASDSLGTMPWHYNYLPQKRKKEKKNQAYQKNNLIILKMFFVGKG